MKTTKEERKKQRRIEKFKNICKMEQTDLKVKMQNVLSSMGYKDVKSEDGFVYAKGDIPVLLLAHMDTVHEQIPYLICEERRDGKTILSSPFGIGGDDRCGIYMILDIVKELKCSVVFLEDEEIGCVGARKFAKSKYIDTLEVNYMIEFDRRGSNDAVFYECDNPDFEDFVTEEFFQTKWGSCSDISHIAPAAGIAAVNLSCGYHDEHQKKETVVFEEMEAVIENAKKLIQKEVTEPFEYIEATYGYGYSYGYGYGGYYNYGSGWNNTGNYSKPAKKRKTYGLDKYLIHYFDTQMKDETYEIVEGFDKTDAILDFLMVNDYVAWRDVYGVYTEDQMIDFGIEL